MSNQANPIFKIAEEAPVEMTLDEVIDEVVTLQKQASAIKKEVDARKSAVKATMRKRELDKYTTPRGSTAKIYPGTNTNPDRALAHKLLTAEQYATLFAPKVTENFKIS